MQEVRYLGHIISPTGILPNPAKVQLIKQYPRPRNVKDVRRFLGMTQYYRRFQKNYANIARPLQNLTKNNVVFEWTDKCQQAFEKID